VTLLKRAVGTSLEATGGPAGADRHPRNGDARAAYNTLEAAAAASPEGSLTAQSIEDSLQRKVLLYDKAGEEHFNLISALHKSVRSSDVDAALYWLSRMLEAGEDRMYIARRWSAWPSRISAWPTARARAIDCRNAGGAFPGDSGRRLALAQAAIYLAVAPKSDGPIGL